SRAAVTDVRGGESLHRHQQRGGDGRDAFPATGQPEPVAGRPGGADRAARGLRQHLLCLLPAGAGTRRLADDLHRGLAPPPADSTRTRVSSSSRTEEAPAYSARPVPNSWPRSPWPAADNIASISAWVATSPSECPAQPSTPSQRIPAIQHSRPASIACTSTPWPMRGLMAAPPESSRRSADRTGW